LEPGGACKLKLGVNFNSTVVQPSPPPPEGTVQARARRLQRLGRLDGLLGGVRGDLVRFERNRHNLRRIRGARGAEGQHHVGGDGRGEPGEGERHGGAARHVVVARAHGVVLGLHVRVGCGHGGNIGLK
jgi:hypothetical protein